MLTDWEFSVFSQVSSLCQGRKPGSDFACGSHFLRRFPCFCCTSISSCISALCVLPISSCAHAASVGTDLFVCACPCGILRSREEPCPCPLGPWALALRTWLSVLRLEHLLRNPAHSLRPGTPVGAHYLPSLLLPASCFFCSCGLLPWFLGLDGTASVSPVRSSSRSLSFSSLHKDHTREGISISRRDTLAA